MSERCAPRWNLFSLATPLIGYLCAVAVAALFDPQAIISLPAFAAWGSFCILGLIAGIIASFRKERLWGLTALGFLLNAPLPMIGLYAASLEILVLTGLMK